MKKLLIAALVACRTSSAFAESGTCKGKTSNNEGISITYFTNGYSDDGVDYYAKININKKGPATYALSIGSGVIIGDATRKSINAGLDYGHAEIKFSKNQKLLSGGVGINKFVNLVCSYKP